MKFTVTDRKNGDNITVDAADKFEAVRMALPILGVSADVYAIPRNDGGGIFDLAVQAPRSNQSCSASFIGRSVHCNPGMVAQIVS